MTSKVELLPLHAESGGSHPTIFSLVGAGLGKLAGGSGALDPTEEL